MGDQSIDGGRRRIRHEVDRSRSHVQGGACMKGVDSGLLGILLAGSQSLGGLSVGYFSLSLSVYCVR